MIRRGELDGANVTMPHKQLAARLTDRNTAEAQRAGAVNTLVRVGPDVVGHNTDIAGVRYAASCAALPLDPVLVLGAGGAAAAALLAFEGRKMTVAARRHDRADALVARLGVDADVIEWGMARPGSVLVNATALGMDNEMLPVADLLSHTGLLDMPYAAGSTPAAQLMRDAGRPVAAGPDMLLGQAIASFRLWSGREPDAAAMRTAMEQAAAP